MIAIAVQSHPQPETTPLSTDWCEIGQHSTWHSLVPLRKQCVCYASALSRVSEQIPGAPGLWCPVLIFGDTANRRVSQTTTFNYWAARTGSKD